MMNAVFMITGMTIGAGILGIPYVVAQVGLSLGIIYILSLGTVVLFFNLMIGEIIIRTKNNYQLPGLAGKYLGKTAKIIMSLMVLLSGLGTLLAYVIGEGQSLYALFGGSSEFWSVIFWTIGSFLVWRGLHTVKVFEKIFSIIVISIILGLSFSIMPQIDLNNFLYFNPNNIFLPFGVILFSFSAAPAIAEAHALLPGEENKFRKALILGNLIPMFVYVVFATAVAGVIGQDTTEIATVVLAERFGSLVGILANMFAVLAMGTGFLGLGIALKQTLTWDWKISSFLSTLLVLVAPLTLFMAGLHSFISVIGLVGGLFLGVEAILIVLVYWRAKKKGDLPARHYDLKNAHLFSALVLLVFTFATFASIIKLINF